MVSYEEVIIPSIKIYVSENQTDSGLLLDVTCGVEEESIPYEVIKCSDNNAVAQSYKGASESVLQVGIGLDADNNIAVHYSKLPESKPLFYINGIKDRNIVRSTCSNAARLVKGTPFIL